MRHMENPYIFMVIAMESLNGGEYVVELLEQDIYQLTMGNQGLLEDADS